MKSRSWIGLALLAVLLSGAQAQATTVFSFSGTAHAFTPGGEAFRGTLTYTPESTSGPDSGSGCYLGLVDYDIRLASGARIQGGLPEANFSSGCWYGDIYDEVPDTDITVPGSEFDYFAEYLYWSFRSVPDPLSPEDLLAGLMGSYWEVFLFDYDAPERFVYGVVESASIVPEPETIALFGLGLVTLWMARRRRRLPATLPMIHPAGR
jgi:hypothetical protein